MSLGYQDIGAARYAAIVGDGPAAPLYAEMDREAAAQGVNPYAILAWLKGENDFGRDISAGLLGAKNLAGIKYVGQIHAINGQPGVVAPLAPASEGSAPYCVFATWGDFFATLTRNIESILPDAFAAGDLNRIAWYYTLGTPGLAHADRGEQHPKAVYFAQYTAGGDVSMINANLVADEAMRHLNERRSGGYDTLNGDHYWCNPPSNDFWCESFVERAHEHVGVSVVPRDTAADKGRALRDQGFMRTDGSNPPRGAVISLDEQYFAGGGHTAISLGDRTMVGTCYPEGIGIRPIPFSSPGYMGWSYYPGVGAGEPTPVPPVSDKLVVPGNPHNKGLAGDAVIGLIGGFKNRWLVLPDPLTILGFPLTNERQVDVFEMDGTARERTAQFFERGTLLYQPELPKPWDVVVALGAQWVVPK